MRLSECATSALESPLFASTTTEELNRLPVHRLFWRYALPSIAGMMVTGLYYLVDGMIVGRYVGGNGLAAINLAYPMIMLVTGLGAMLAMGGATRLSLRQGAGDPAGARRALANTLLLLGAGGALIPVLSLWQMDRLLCWLKADANPELLAHTGDYLGWVLTGSVLLMGQMAVAALLRNDGRPQLATLLLSCGAVLNMGLCYWFVAHLGWGLVGAAASTLLAEGLVVIIGLGYFFSPHARLRLGWRDLRPHRESAAALLALGSPNLLMELNLALLLYAHNYQLLSYGNEENVAAFAVTGYTEAMFVLLVHGLAMGMQPLLSHAAGAEQHDRARATLRYGLAVILGLGGAGLLLILGAPGWIAGLFAGDAPHLQQLAERSLQLHLFALPLDGLLIVGVVALQAMARTRRALIMTGCKTLLLAPALIGLPLWLGVDGVLLAAPLVNSALGLIMAGLLFVLLRQLGGQQTQMASSC